MYMSEVATTNPAKAANIASITKSLFRVRSLTNPWMASSASRSVSIDFAMCTAFLRGPESIFRATRHKRLQSAAPALEGRMDEVRMASIPAHACWQSSHWLDTGPAPA